MLALLYRRQNKVVIVGVNGWLTVILSFLQNKEHSQHFSILRSVGNRICILPPTTIMFIPRKECR